MNGTVFLSIDGEKRIGTSVNEALLCHALFNGDLVMSEACISSSIYTALCNDPAYLNPLPLSVRNYFSFCNSNCQMVCFENGQLSNGENAWLVKNQCSVYRTFFVYLNCKSESLRKFRLCTR